MAEDEGLSRNEGSRGIGQQEGRQSWAESMVGRTGKDLEVITHGKPGKMVSGIGRLVSFGDVGRIHSQAGSWQRT